MGVSQLQQVATLPSYVWRLDGLLLAHSLGQHLRRHMEAAAPAGALLRGSWWGPPNPAASRRRAACGAQRHHDALQLGAPPASMLQIPRRRRGRVRPAFKAAPPRRAAPSPLFALSQLFELPVPPCLTWPCSWPPSARGLSNTPVFTAIDWNFSATACSSSSSPPACSRWGAPGPQLLQRAAVRRWRARAVAAARNPC